MNRSRLAALLSSAGLVLATAAVSVPAEAHDSRKHNRLFGNCTSFNDRFEHGVGRRGARDQTSGDPVTTFKRSTRIYKRAMRHNSDLDRDRDGIACEQA